jgi:ABC-type bacteriocin/lantibiotic exporter with double-glycine peptidase domain
MISTVRALARLLRRSRLWLGISATLAVAQSALLVPIGLLIRRTLDHTIPDDHVGQLLVTGVLLLVLSISSAGLGLATRYLALRATKAAIRDLRKDLVALVLRLPASWFDRHEVGGVHAVIVQDSERLDIIGNAVAAQLVPAGVIAIALSIALAVIDPLLFALLAVALPIIMLLTRAMGRLVRRRTRLWQEAFDTFSSRVLFILGARSLIVTHTAEDREEAAASREIAELSLAGRQMAWSQSAYGQLSATVGVIAALIVLVVGGAAVAHHHTTVGSLVGFYALAALLRTQISQVLAALPQLISGGESLRRLQALLDVAEQEPYDGTRKIAFRGSIVLSAVQFGYREGEPVLRGADLELHPGERVALVGANGAGKSTVAALMLGQYRPWQGELRADGVPFDELDIRALRRRMAMVAEQPVLFPGTIAENIAYGRSGADLASVRRAAQHATAEAFIESLPAGYATPVGERGELLSGGQRQRIAIARALLREPALLILDEPTSNLDNDAVARLLEQLRELPWQPAVLLISHQRAVIDEADRIYELTAGCVCAAMRT